MLKSSCSCGKWEFTGL
ncbi:hypothetical protein [Duganella sp. S19_KUP01_CR8]